MVKLLEEPLLLEVNMLLAGLCTGKSVIEGRIDLYSCKLAGEDKRVSKSLEQQYIEELQALDSTGSSPGSAPSSAGGSGVSPIGPLSDSSSRRTLINLILTLNASFPDYEFSSLRPEDFIREPALPVVGAKINRDLCWGTTGTGTGQTPQEELMRKTWAVMEQVIAPTECSIYSYQPDTDCDPLSNEGKIWSFNYFFYNKKLKRMLFFTCENSVDQIIEDDEDGYSDMMVGDMDE